MEKVFKSKFTRGGSALRPDVITITDTKMIYTKRNSNLIGKDEKTIKIEEIVEISIDTHLIGADLIVKTRGMGRIKIESFDKNDIKEIKRIIEQRQDYLSSSSSVKEAKQPIIKEVIKEVVKEQPKSKEVQLEELRIKEEKRKEKLKAEKYKDVNQIPSIKFNKDNVIEELQQLLINYKLKTKSKSTNIENLETLYTIYNHKINEGILFLKKHNEFKDDVSYYVEELEKIKNVADNKIQQLNEKKSIQNQKIIQIKKSNSKRKKITYGILGFFVVLILFFIFKPSSKEEIKPIQLKVLNTNKLDKLSEYIKVISDTTILNTEIHDEIPLVFKILKKVPFEIKASKLSSSLKFYDKDTILVTKLKDFNIKYLDKDKFIDFLKNDNGKISILYDGYLIPSDVEYIKNNVRFISIEFKIKK